MERSGQVGDAGGELAAGPTPLTARAVAPDLTRAVMLLLIAVANVHIWLFDRPPSVRGYFDAGGALDRALSLVQTVLADGPGLPLFAAVLGFGAVRIAERHERGTLTRRGLAMIAIGVVHGILLFPGEILAAYGLITILITPALVGPAKVSSSTLLRIAGGLALLAVLLGASQGQFGLPEADTSLAAPGFGEVLSVHPALYLNYLVVSVLFGLPGAMVGVYAARLGVLDDPAAHRATLRRWALAGSAVMIVLGLPLGFAAAGWWVPGANLALAVGAAHVVAGFAGVFGYLGLFGLVSLRRFPGRATLAAAGTWSMSLYLSQSVVFAVLFPAWALGWGATASIATASAVGLVTWLVGVLVAGVLARRGHRGPAELLVRRLAYR